MSVYTWCQWLAFFYIYCFFGWIFESVYVSVKQHRFVNRGFLRGPMLPLYGSGAVMMLLVSLPFRSSLVMVYISGLVGATCLEFFTGIVMEKIFKIKYWDYSNQKFQYKGYICLSSSLTWGLLTILLTEVIQTPVANLVSDFSQVNLTFLLSLITIIFLADIFESTRTALDLAKALETMTKIKAELEEAQLQLALLKDNTMQKFGAARQETAERFSAAKISAAEHIGSANQRVMDMFAQAESKLQDMKSDFGDRPEYMALKEKLVALKRRIPALPEYMRPSLSNYQRLMRRSILRGNPYASSKFSDALKEFKDAADKRSSKSRSKK